MLDEQRDFFISYNKQDGTWAEWIAGALEDQKYTVFLQAWDIRPGSNFMAEMQAAAQRCARTLGVLSPDALDAPYVQQEWFAALVNDPLGKERRFVPVRVRDCKPTGLLGPIVYLDLVGLSEDAARARLLDGVSAERRSRRVAFPGAPAAPQSRGVPFPGTSSTPTPPVKPPPVVTAEPGVPIFVGVTAKDLEHAEALDQHLFQAQRRGELRLWHHGLLHGGDAQAESDRRLDEARIILLLISPTLIGTREGDGLIERALQRAAAGVRVVPVLVRAADWKETALGKLTALPRSEKPISEWSNRDSAYTEVAREVSALARGLAKP